MADAAMPGDPARLVLGVDVGSVRRPGGFSWSNADGTISGQDDPQYLAMLVCAALDAGTPVALAFESPLSVPVPLPSDTGWKDLGRARTGEGNRPWSAGAGSGALATGLVQLAWVLAVIRAERRAPTRTTTRADRLLAGLADLLLVEAMVTGDGKPQIVGNQAQDQADAMAAAMRTEDLLATPGVLASDVSCAPHLALNLAAAAAMHAGLSIDSDELRSEVLVAKARSVLGREA